jgi:hypothetical protein
MRRVSRDRAPLAPSPLLGNGLSGGGVAGADDSAGARDALGAVLLGASSVALLEAATLRPLVALSFNAERPVAVALVRGVPGCGEEQGDMVFVATTVALHVYSAARRFALLCACRLPFGANCLAASGATGGAEARSQKADGGAVDAARVVAVGSANGVQLFRLAVEGGRASLAPTAAKALPLTQVTAAAMGASGRVLACGSLQGGVTIFAVDGGQRLRQTATHWLTARVTSVCVSPHELCVAAAAWDGATRLLVRERADSEAWQQLEAQGPPAQGLLAGRACTFTSEGPLLAWAPGGEFIAVAAADEGDGDAAQRIVSVRSARSGLEYARVALGARPVKGLATCNDALLVAVASPVGAAARRGDESEEESDGEDAPRGAAAPRQVQVSAWAWPDEMRLPFARWLATPAATSATTGARLLVVAREADDVASFEEALLGEPRQLSLRVERNRESGHQEMDAPFLTSWRSMLRIREPPLTLLPSEVAPRFFLLGETPLALAARLLLVRAPRQGKWFAHCLDAEACAAWPLPGEFGLLVLTMRGSLCLLDATAPTRLHAAPLALAPPAPTRSRRCFFRALNSEDAPRRMVVAVAAAALAGSRRAPHLAAVLVALRDSELGLAVLDSRRAACRVPVGAELAAVEWPRLVFAAPRGVRGVDLV